jgi:DNA-directed RNA polymerase subunit F
VICLVMRKNKMTEDQLRDERDKWVMVQYRMEDEGMEYCFRHYSSFSEIQDEEFQTLKNQLLELMGRMDQMVTNKIEELDNQINNLEEQ